MQAAALAAADAAEAARAEAAWRLDQRTVKSDVSGRVEQVYRRQGEFVAAGAQIVSILPPDAAKVRFFVPQAAVAGLAPGDIALVRADGRDAAIRAEISFIAGEAEFTPPVIYSAGARDKLVFLVEARLPADAALAPGLPVDVSLP